MTVTMTLKELVTHHHGEIMLTWRGADYSVSDILFPTLADGQHFHYAANQSVWKDEILSVQHIANHADGRALYSVYANLGQVI